MKDAVSGNIASHYFGIPGEIKDVNTKHLLKLMYNTEFSVAGLEGVGIGSDNFEELSYEDKKFLEMIDENTKKVGKHYQLPLPLKNHKKFPNNRYLAEKRLQYLKGRFIKNPKLFMDYKGFMDNLIKKSSKEAPEKTWYIPHHGVYHPNKPGKIRVVFDCSAEFKEVSLNKTLMSGLDLTNQIVGVLTRFHEEPVVIMGDIESMFHQVMVPKEDRSLLRFLWWEDHDINGSAKDFEMCVHVFGGTSSPSCCNYALKQTAYDNRSRYQTDVMDTLNRNFYVDDLLRSVKDVKTAIRLLHDVTSMCADGGFWLTKLVSNRTEVLDSIPEEARRTGVKDVYLTLTVVPIFPQKRLLESTGTLGVIGLVSS